MSWTRLRTAAGLAAAVVPSAILVHLVAEAFSVGRDTFTGAFLVRHLYLGALFVLTMTWFGHTVGLQSGTAERRRRCALIGAQLRGASRHARVAVLAIANISFFGVSQAIEGVPIATGDWCIGLAAAIVGSLVAALVVYFCSQSIVLAVLTAIGSSRCRKAIVKRSTNAGAVVPRCAAVLFSLFVPNRPPPIPFLV